MVVLAIDRVDLECMRTFANRQATDAAVHAEILYNLTLLPVDVQNQVYCIDPLFSVQLLNDREPFIRLMHWFSGVNLDEAKVIFMASNKDEHWSLLLYAVETNTCHLANSRIARAYHGHVRKCAKKFVNIVEHLIVDPGRMERMRTERLIVPVQPDIFSCVFNSSLAIRQIFELHNDIQPHNYTDFDVTRHTVMPIQGIVAGIHSHHLEETLHGEEWQQQAMERAIAQAEEINEAARQHAEAMRQFEIDQAEVEEFVRRRDAAAREREEAAARAEGQMQEQLWVERENALHEIREPLPPQRQRRGHTPSHPTGQRCQSRAPRAPRGSRGERGSGVDNVD